MSVLDRIETMFGHPASVVARLRISLVLGACLALAIAAGCGQKGALVLPKPVAGAVSAAPPVTERLDGISSAGIAPTRP